MKIGILSDTHDQVALISKALRAFQEEEVEHIFHLGDWCSPFSLQLFSDAGCPVTGIFGNNDADIFKLLSVSPDNVTLKDRFSVEKLDGLQIALLHGDPEELAQAVFESERYDLVLRGHSHVHGTERRGRTRMINPGGLIPPFGDKPWSTPSVVVYSTKLDTVSFIELA